MLLVVCAGLAALWVISDILWLNIILSILLVAAGPWIAHRAAPCITGGAVESLFGVAEGKGQSQTDAWERISATVEWLTTMPGFSVEACEAALGCRLKQAGAGRYRATGMASPLASAEVRVTPGGGILAMQLERSPDQASLARRARQMGEPEDIDIVSPPLAEPGRTSGVSWDSRYSHRYNIKGRNVWFGYEKFRGVERLVEVCVEFGENLSAGKRG